MASILNNGSQHNQCHHIFLLLYHSIFQISNVGFGARSILRDFHISRACIFDVVLGLLYWQ